MHDGQVSIRAAEPAWGSFSYAFGPIIAVVVVLLLLALAYAAVEIILDLTGAQPLLVSPGEALNAVVADARAAGGDPRRAGGVPGCRRGAGRLRCRP